MAASFDSASFVHLRVHSEFSLVDGLVRVKSLVAECDKMAMPAVALTDHSNLFALVKFHKAAMGAGIKPIFGADILLENQDPEDDPTRLSLLVVTEKGYSNLIELISKSYLKNQHLGRALVKREWVKDYSEGLIALSGAKDGEVGSALLAGHPQVALDLLDEWMSAFPDRFYLDLQRTGREYEEDYLHAAVKLAEETQCPVVATNDVRFIKGSDFDAHEARVCIHEGCTLDDPRRAKLYSEQQYLRSPEEMQELFSDIPEALANTVEIAKRCTLNLVLGKSFLPDFPLPEGMTIEEFFSDESLKGLELRLENILDKQTSDYTEQKQVYLDRLKFELDIINQMGFPGYFLIVMDFIRWSKENDIPVGPGRGSGAGSLVAYALKITDLDPIEYELLFERFLNPERVSMPDFDIDFCMDGRDRVIDYVARTYGRSAVSQIITFGTMAAKAVVRDVARVQGKSYGLADRLSKMIPFEVGITLKSAIEQEQPLRDFLAEDDEAAEIMDMAFKLEGITRNVGKHAGGVVIAPGKLTDFSALYCDDEGNNLVTQYDKDDVEQAGLVKFDFLGLRTLTIIDWAVKFVNQRQEEKGLGPINIETIPLDDSGVFDLLKAAQTTAVFQLESSGMKDLIKRLLPDDFEDIIALVALFRPGPLQSGMVDDFINRKHGRQSVEYPHPDLEPILGNTYGVILYQEQVMQIAQVLANYTLGEADMLRRAMGKKKPEEMAKQRVFFNKGASENNIDEKTATYIFDLMEKFAGYGFNKSHSAAYALVSYQTAWMKHHYPAEFMAAVLSADMDNTDKVVTLIDECSHMELPVLPPNVNNCHYKFSVNDDGAVVYGLGAIKGLGEGPIDSIVFARSENDTDFIDLFDFTRRIDLKKTNRRALEALVRSGALDLLSAEKHFDDRASLMASLDNAIQSAEQEASNAAAGMMDLFGDVSNDATESQYVSARVWKDDERLTGEKETLGLYLTGHPIDQFEDELQHFTSCRIVNVQPNDKGQTSVVAGLVIAIRTMKNKRGQKMSFMTIDDKSGRLEVSVFSDVFDLYYEHLQKDKLLVIDGEVSHDDYSGSLKVVARKIFDIDQARDNYAQEIRLNVDYTKVPTDFVSRLSNTLQPYRNGKCRFTINYQRPEASVLLQLGDDWAVQARQQLVEMLQAEYGRTSVSVQYSKSARR